MITITAITLSALHESGVDYEVLLQYLTGSSRDKLNQITNPESRDRSLLGELLTRYGISRYFGIPNQDIEFSYLDKGKPHLPGHPGIHFNMSHSSQVICCALAGSEIGVDVEHHRKVNFRVAERFFSSREIADLMAMDEVLRTEYFFTLWTIKESFLKAIGSGLTRTLNSFTVGRQGKKFVLYGDELSESFSVHTYRIHGNYHLAACCRDSQFPSEVQMVEISEILNYLT